MPARLFLNFSMLSCNVWIPTKKSVRMVIECDGYETHSTKDKFTTDRQRDRAFSDAGWEVRRFSGSEMFNDPVKVGGELFTLLWDQIPRKGKLAGIFGDE